VAFVSNVLFWQQSGYFGPAAEEVPLLHTWSLAVEEQFYIVFPLFLLLVARRFDRRYVPATLLVTVSAFVLSLVLVTTDRDAAFYLAPPRAWELGIGALLALGVLRPTHDVRLRGAVGVLGAGAIAWSVFAFSSTTVFPGAAALLPCLGTAAILWAGTGGPHLLGRVLATRPLVLVGLVSYSLYLWHWPLLAFGRYYAGRALTPVETTVALSLAVVASVVSWRYVERPFRGKSGVFERRSLFVVALTAMAVFAGAGVVTLTAAGFPQRLDPGVQALLAGAKDRRPHDWACSNRTATALASGDLCDLGAASSPPTFIVWGDSHGRVLADPIDSAARRAGVHGLLAVYTGCAPLPGVRRADQPEADCREFNDATIALIERSPAIVDVVLAGRWGLVAEGTRYGAESGGDAFLQDEVARAANPAGNQPIFERALRRTVERLRASGKRVWIVGSVPEVGWNVPSVLARAARAGRMPPSPPSRAEFDRRQAFAASVLSQLDALEGVTVLWPHQALCDEVACDVIRDGRPMYFDAHHLTLHGSATLEPLFERVFAR
jgi:hypothetical protein